MKKIITTLSLSLLTTLSVLAQERPTFRAYEYDSQSPIASMSDNGKWAVASSNRESVATTRLINLETNEVTMLSSSAATEYAADVTDDGMILVGNVAGHPAIYSALFESWMPLETKSPYVNGNAVSVTPDGRYAVGVLYYGDGYYSIPALWELTEEGGTLVQDIYTMGGLPTKDMAHKDQQMMDFRAISADGRYILGCMSFSYLPTSLDNGGCFYFVYDREKASYKPIGFTETETGRWTPKSEGLIVIMEAAMSNNGRYVTGNAHTEGDGDEYELPFLYDVERDKFVAYNEVLAQNTYGSAVTNDGVVLSASPVSTPVREWSVRLGKYWFSFDEILKQKYGMNFKDASTFDNTGTVNCITDDGKRLAVFPDPYTSYVVDLPVRIQEIGEGIKLLGSYNVSPVAGSTVSHLKNITVTFDRTITAVGGANIAELQDAEGNKVYSSIGFNAEGKQLSIRFRTGTLNEGEQYTLFIPEGSVALADDATQTNADIRVAYKGRHDEPVAVTGFYPEQGTAFSHIDYSTSPVMLTFDTDIKIANDARAYLYRNDEAEPFCALSLASSDCRLALYPATTQYLFEGSTYRVEISAGAVTDVAGNNPSEAISITYSGNYVRQISADDVVLFSDDFDSGYGNFMQWDGDLLQPTEAMVNWDFQQGMAWGLVRADETSGDMIACSHSCYTTAGASDDWLVIPQIYIPDMLCSVKFQSQGYRKDKQDILKVIVWESEKVYNTLTQSVIDQMKAEGKVIYAERQDPGASEEDLDGEWTSVNLSLANYAGKSIYIALVNQNENQSAIFVNQIEVRHEMNFLVSIANSDRVVNRESLDIRGSLIGNNDAKAYDKLTLTLVDASGETVSTYTASGIALAKNQKHDFAFAQPLPLTIGEINKYTLHVDLDGEVNEIHGTIKDLTYEPIKRIVLEEYSGRACGNCPLGIIGIEKLEARYGESFIPISIHTYNNDPLGNGLSSYSSSLGLDAIGAPSGIVNRQSSCYPAVSAEVDGVNRYFFTAAEAAAATGEEQSDFWMDYANAEMAQPAECGIEIVSLPYNETMGNLLANCEIKYALNATNQTVNLFAALVEDNISQAQSNYTASISTPDLGEWSLGGKYGQAVVTDYLHQDVCRNVVGLTINGTGGYLPSTVEAGKTYTAQVAIPVPATVTDLRACKAIVMMIDANTGHVINAARLAYKGETDSAIESIEADGSEAIIFDLNGRAVENVGKGLYIIGGKKVIVIN